MFFHIVLFTPKPGLLTAQKRSFARSFKAATNAIPSVKRARIGHSTTTASDYGNGPDLKSFEYAAVVEFKDSTGLHEYLNHAAHQELGRMFWEFCSETAIVDCELITADDIADVLLV